MTLQVVTAKQAWMSLESGPRSQGTVLEETPEQLIRHVARERAG